MRAEDEDSEEEGEGADGEKLFKGRMLGTDYSATSITFARAVAAERGLADGAVEFVEWDILNSPSTTVLSGPNEDGFDVVLDKGTFDAVSLMGDPEAGRRYVERVREVVRKGGWAVVTSCNWTEGEVRGWFEGGGLEWGGRVEYRVFRFGGGEGQSICTCYFRRV